MPPYFLLLLLLLFLLPILLEGKRLPDIHWNSTSQIFDSGLSKTTPQQEATLELAVEERDTIDFVCPSPTVNEGAVGEVLIISMVSEMSFVNCQLDDGAVEFLVCNGRDGGSGDGGGDVGAEKRKRIIFRRFSPTPRAVVFRPGSSYYFISTSDGTPQGMRNSQRGFCATKNMRLKIDFNTRSDQQQNDSNSVGEEERIDYTVEEQPSSSPPLTTTASHKKELSLSEVFNINPEYLEFVRNHAVQGGTGAIQFPSEDDPNSPNKHPRFVSREPNERGKGNAMGGHQAEESSPLLDSPPPDNSREWWGQGASSSSTTSTSQEQLEEIGEQLEPIDSFRNGDGGYMNGNGRTLIISISFLLLQLF